MKSVVMIVSIVFVTSYAAEKKQTKADQILEGQCKIYERGLQVKLSAAAIRQQ